MNHPWRNVKGAQRSGSRGSEIDELPGRRVLDIEEAAAFLDLPIAAVSSLVTQGYLNPLEEGPEGPRFAASDLKGFQARNAPEADIFLHDVHADPRALLEALDGRSDEMARRAFELFLANFPEAAEWSSDEQAHFIDQARKRFEAILAVTGQGEEVDHALVADLEAVGAGAAWSGSPLPHLLVVLRISRDLVVQTAVEIAEERGRHWGLALSLLLTRVLPAIDRLTDALARGYWAAVLGREEELRERLESLVEHASDGVYEVDLDGRISYVNPAFAAIVARSREHLVGAPLGETLIAPPGTIEKLMSEPRGETEQVEIEVLRPDGVRRLLQVTTFPRRSEGVVVGFQGIARDITAQRELDRAKSEFLALITRDLRNPLSTILGYGVTLEAYGDELPAERLARMGAAIHRQAERMSRLADDLYDVSRLESQSLALHLGPVEVAEAVEAALASVEEPAEVEVAVPEDTRVMADVRRLEQLLANLVENAVVHGEPPVRVEAVPEGGEVCISVVDHGSGVPEGLVGTLFSGVSTLSRHDRNRAAGTGLGLFLVKGLVEAMGGRVTYEQVDHGGAAFRLWLPAPST